MTTLRVRRTARWVAALSLTVTALVGSAAFASSALASPAGDLATATNSARVSAGLPALTENAQLDAVAQAWANKLAAAGVLSHNPAVRTQVTNWTVLGENVGMAGDVPTVQNAFMHSPEHKANILDPRYTQMGVGSATSIYPSCGCPVLWVVVDFRRPVTVTTAPVAPKAPAPVKTVAPKPATTKPVAVKPAAVKAAPKVTAVTQHVATAATVTVPAAAAPTAVPSATALRSQLAASATPASTGDPVSRMLNFATVLSQLPN
ncbi:MAG TPA: CAP domain-containing protein [Acidothermaceae bacterium]